MAELIYCFTMDDVALDGYSSETHFEKVLDFCGEQGIRGTFFTVPRSGGVEISSRPGYVRLLKRAVKEGHEIGQHGLEHDRFESGVPPQMILDMEHEGPAREYLASSGEELRKRHTVEALSEMLAEGRRLLSGAAGAVPAGFRGPAAAVCGNLNRAQSLGGYSYDSSIMMQESAWHMLNGKRVKPRPITRELFDAAQPEEDIMVIPGAGEYTWYLSRGDYGAFMELARHDCLGCFEAGIPFVSISHVSPIQQAPGLDDSDLGFVFYRELIDYARRLAEEKGADFSSMTLLEARGRMSGS